MKKLGLLALILLLASSCKEEKIEVVNVYDDYYSKTEVEEPAKLEGQDMTEFNRALSLLGRENEETGFHFIYYISETGSIDKIQSLYGKTNNEALALLDSVRFNPAKKDGKYVRSMVDFGPSSAGRRIAGNFDTGKFFVAVDQMPELIGGIGSLQEKIVYPEIMKRAGIDGRVYVKAFIDTSGNVVRTDIIKGIAPALDSAAVEAVRQAKFIPGRQRGQAVPVQVSIPIVFKLQ